MAKSRYVKDSIRSDNWYTDISVSEKLLFVYILTNDKVGLCGVYELPMKKIQRETGIDSGTLGKAFERFESIGKVCYRNGWIMITNFFRNQSMNENMVKGARREAESIKEEVWLSFVGFKGFERLLNDFKSFDILNLTLLNLTLPDGTESSGGIDTPEQEEKKEDKLAEFVERRNNATIGTEKAFPKCMKVTDDLKKAWTTLSKQLTYDDLVQAANNYIIEIKGRRKDSDYAKHRFSLGEFLEQKNGARKFYNYQQ